MKVRSLKLAVAFTVIYVLHVGYSSYYTLRIEGVEGWLCPIGFLVVLNALGFLVWVTRHRWVALINVLIHLVGTLGEAKNAFLAGTTLRIPLFATHVLMLIIFLYVYMHSE